MIRRSEKSWTNSSPEKDRSAFLFVFLVLWAILVSQCAHRGPPPGGPVDRTAPEVVDHLPQSDATHVPLTQEIAITFSEAMDKASVVDALFISPAPKEAPKFKWKGRRILVTLAGGLQKDKTYVITLGTGCKDLHNNNLLRSQSFAFSTGEKIDQGSIVGRVYEDISPRMGVDLWAYQIEGNFQPDPSVHLPDYITQTDADGYFHLSHLGQGRYRIYAVEDANDDRKFDALAELLAVPSADAIVSESEPYFQAPALRLAKLDTTGPRLRSVQATLKDRVVLSFDEPLDSTGAVNPASYRLVCPVEESVSVEIKAVSLACGSRDRVTLSTAPLEEGRRYLVVLSGLTDLAGNPVVPPEQAGEFLGSGLPDTQGPKLISFWPPDSAQTVPWHAAISLCFDEAVEPVSVETSFAVLDSLGGTLPGRFRWEHGAKMVFLFDEKLKGGQLYRIRLEAAGVRDLAGNAMGEDTIETWFQTVQAEILGSVSGKILRPGIYDSATAVIRASGLDQAGGNNSITTQEEEYCFSRLLPGRYLFSAFLDLDANGRYGFGRPVPFVPAEPFTVRQDTVVVRSRWETAGVDIVFGP